MFHYYNVYQLTVQSALPLPELNPVPQGVADVVIDCAPLPLPGEAARQLGPYLWQDDQAVILQVPGVAGFRIAAGKQITVDMAPGADADSVRLFLLGSAMGALLHQRGLLVLHGNAVQIGDSCLVCVGDSGAGKSTLAAALMQRGYPLLADDVVPVNDRGEAIPGFPRVKLWQDSAERLSVATEGLAAIRPGLQKFQLPTHQAMASRPLPVRWLYVLNQHAEDHFVLTPLQGMARFDVLRAHTYRLRLLQGSGAKPLHLQHCATLSAGARMARLTRPTAGFRLDELVAHILADIEVEA